MPTYPVVPTFITVHLGLPDSSAPNVTVPFTSYIKNVASHELYPTWPEAALPGQYHGPDLLCPEPGVHRVLPQPGL